MIGRLNHVAIAVPSLAEARKDLNDLAEGALRRSLARKRTPEAMNDLACLLFERGKFNEVEKLAREALAIDDQLYQVWDTLGEVLIALGCADEAEQAFESSLVLVPDDPAVLLHMAEAHFQRGDYARCRTALDQITPKEKAMTVTHRGVLAQLRKTLDRAESS